MNADSPLGVETISDGPSFDALEPLWNRLVEEAGIVHPFLTHEWVRAWWECFGDGKELRVLIVKAGKEVTAVAPLMLSRRRIYGVPVREMEFMANVYTERFDMVVARRHQESYRAIWKDLVQEKARWDVLRLCQLTTGSSTLKELTRLAEGDGFLTGIWRSSDSPYLTFDEEWEAYFKRLSSNLRHKVRKGFNRLEEAGPVRLEVVSSGEPIEAALSDGFRLEGMGWKSRSGTAIHCRPELERFLTRLSAAASRSGMLRLLFLTVGGTRIAFAYALRYQNRLFVLKAGYDPRYARYSPYHLLCYLVFRDAREHDLIEYEFLGGDEEWKLRWTPRTRSHFWMYVFSPSLRTRFLHAAKFRIIPSLQGLGLYRLVRDAVIKRIQSS
jgi:CelD/BcsL family acetyltransferase involved in cellulose biosynthesis